MELTPVDDYYRQKLEEIQAKEEQSRQLKKQLDELIEKRTKELDTSINFLSQQISQFNSTTSAAPRRLVFRQSQERVTLVATSPTSAEPPLGKRKEREETSSEEEEEDLASTSLSSLAEQSNTKKLSILQNVKVQYRERIFHLPSGAREHCEFKFHLKKFGLDTSSSSIMTNIDDWNIALGKEPQIGYTYMHIQVKEVQDCGEYLWITLTIDSTMWNQHRAKVLYCLTFKSKETVCFRIRTNSSKADKDKGACRDHVPDFANPIVCLRF